MRLTLRTLLAHLDGVPVDSADSEEFAKKVEESEFVRNLVQRIRTLIARPRLSAPKIDGQGLGHDPNTVAAYLDNTLPQGRMPDLEKLCLESDVLLSEVAACHQILSLVLKNPAEVSPQLRERVYRIGDLGKAASVAAAAPPPAPTPPPVQEPVAEAVAPPAGEPTAPPAAAPPEKPVSESHEIAEYLRPTRSTSWKPLVATLALGFLLAAIVLRAMGPFDADHPVLGYFAGDRPVVRALPEDEVEDDDVAPDSEPPIEKTQPEGPEAELETESDADEGASPLLAVPETKEKPKAVTPAEAEEEDVAVATEAPKLPATPETDEEPKPTDAVDAAVVETPVTPGEKAAMVKAAPAGDELAATSPTTEDPIPRPILDDAPSPEKKPAPAPATPDLGRFISEREVLARRDPATGAWMRLPTNAPLGAGEQLLAFPAYRPKVVLASGIQMTLGGGTLVELRSPAAPNAANIAVEYGRVVLVPVGAGGTVALDLWGREGELTFESPMSVAAVQVRRYRSPGVDPEAGLAHRMVEIYAVNGGLRWREPNHPEQVIGAGATFAFLDEARGGVTPTDETPVWVQSKDVERIDEMAAQDIDGLIALDRPLTLTLLELAEHRKVEVRALAMRSLSHLGQFEPFVNAFSDESQKSYWDDLFNEIQRALARSPETAAEARIAFEKVRGPVAADELYRLLWSYSPEDLAGGAAEKLVAYLSHESLGFRVLAFENLRRITGETLLYRPEVSEVRRREAARRWQEKAAAGEIRYEEPVLMLPPRPAPATGDEDVE